MPGTRLDQDYSNQIQNLWDYSNQIKDTNYFIERLKDGYFYGIVIDGELISFLGSLGETDVTVVLGMLFTKPEFRRNHFGISCASLACKAILESHRIPMCYVQTDNIASIAIWEKLGFVVTFWKYIISRKFDVL